MKNNTDNNEIGLRDKYSERSKRQRAEKVPGTGDSYRFYPTISVRPFSSFMTTLQS